MMEAIEWWKHTKALEEKSVVAFIDGTFCKINDLASLRQTAWVHSKCASGGWGPEEASTGCT